MMKLYRADDRAPEIIKRFGFQARKPMTVAAVRSLLLAYCVKGKSPLDLSRLIISNPQPEFVSTDPDPDCGGYSTKGFIYLIEFPQLEIRGWNDFVLGIKMDFKVNSFVPKLYLDTASIVWAKIIALKHFGATKEVTFLTGIPPANIVAYKKSGDFSFKKM